MNTYEIKSLSHFTEIVENNFDDQSNFLFRSQRSDRHLVPSIARERLTEATLIAEKLMLEEFKRQCVPYLKTMPETTWDWLALAQHHGLPTRLLDWSLNPFAALWFAVERPPTNNGNGVV
jgi:hypothetical protein